MPLPRPTSLPRLARRAIASPALLGALLALATGASASAQSVQGGIGASLTILAPVGGAAVQASALSMSRAGILSMDTTSPVSGPTSQIVMVDVSDDDAAAGSVTRVAMRSGTSERALTQGRAMPVGVDGIAPAAGKAGDFRVNYAVKVGTRKVDAAAVHLTVRYLAVAGT